MSKQDIKFILAGGIKVGDRISIQGWVRSRRDSKAGISFIAVYDGSCFDSLQAVVPNTLDNYEPEVLHITAGCAVTISGELMDAEDFVTLCPVAGRD